MADDVDKTIADRLNRLRQPEHCSTIAEKLKSKLENSNLYQPSTYSKNNVTILKKKSNQQQSDELLQQYVDECEIDDSKNSIDETLMNRLQALRTDNIDTEKPPSDQKHTCSKSFAGSNIEFIEASSETTDDYIKKCIKEMEEKMKKKEALKQLQNRCKSSENENYLDEKIHSVIAEALSDISDDDFGQSSTSSSDETE